MQRLDFRDKSPPPTIISLQKIRAKENVPQKFISAKVRKRLMTLSQDNFILKLGQELFGIIY
jgi:hypothetical protein